MTTGQPEARGVRILTGMIWALIVAGLGWAVFVASLEAAKGARPARAGGF